MRRPPRWSPRPRRRRRFSGDRAMSVLVGNDTKLLVQGITGREGSFHATQMVEYGTNVVAGVTPGKAGAEVAGVPVFNTVADAVKETQANTSIIYIPARFARSEERRVGKESRPRWG